MGKRLLWQLENAGTSVKLSLLVYEAEGVKTASS
jgi:hypothetical protein